MSQPLSGAPLGIAASFRHRSRRVKRHTLRRTACAEPEAPEILRIVGKYTHQSVEQAKLGVPNVDPEGRLDVKDVLHQIAWYKQQNMLKGGVSGDAVIDKRCVTALPEP